MRTKKKVLLVDLDDSRRETRVTLLANAGYDVDLREDHVAAEELDDEANYDLMIVALHTRPEDAAAYTDRISRKKPELPILLLTDYGVFIPRGTLSRSIETGDPRALLMRVAEMLTGTKELIELPSGHQDEQPSG
jgi:hypothetical protein